MQNIFQVEETGLNDCLHEVDKVNRRIKVSPMGQKLGNQKEGWWFKMILFFNFEGL